MENLRVVLVAPRNPLNVGAVARAMSNFGALHLRVVAPYQRAFREAKSAVGAAELLEQAEEFASLKEAVADCTLVVGTTAIGNREITLPLQDLDVAGGLIGKRMARSRVALLFGSEKWGLSNESLSYCHWLLHIPTRTAHYSMNLGQAVAVCLWELRRGSAESREQAVPRGGEARAAGTGASGRIVRNNLRSVHPDVAGGATRSPDRSPSPREGQSARVETVEMITEVLLENLLDSGYIPPRGRATAEMKLRKMLRRFALDEADAVVFLGMLRKIAWKIGEKR